MSNTKHTPGPWSIHPYQTGHPLEISATVDAPGYTCWNFAIGSGETLLGIAHASSDGGAGYPRPKTREEAEANARLIAAAPEMISALETLADLAVNEPDQVVGYILASDSPVRAVIAKAKGGDQ